MTSKGVLWGFPLSFASQKALLGLEEKKVPYEYKKINILLGDNFKADYMKINHNATVPTFVVGDKIITDSTDLLKYLDGIDEPLGGDQVDRAKVEEWYQRQAAWDDSRYTYAVQGVKASSPLVTVRLKALEARKKENPDLAEFYDAKLKSANAQAEDAEKPEVYESLQKQLGEILDVAEAQLGTTPYVAGEAFSMADVALMTILNRVEFLSKTKELITPRPHLSKYWKEAKQRPSYKKAMGPVAGAKALPLILGVVSGIAYRSLFRRY